MVIVASSIVYTIMLRFQTEFDPISEQPIFICHEGIVFTMHFPSRFKVVQCEFISYENHDFFLFWYKNDTNSVVVYNNL